jgi:hypothetical protein
MKHAPRLASPIGFGLALLLFLLLPFVAVSCEVPGLGSAELSYSGADLVGNADPSVSTEGEFDSGGEAAPITDNENPPTPGGGGQVLAIITLVLLVGGLGVSLIPLARTRLVATAGAALLGGVGLITTQAVTQSNLSSAILDAAQKESTSSPDDLPINLTSGLIDDMVQTRFGFWLSLIAVFLVLLYSAGTLLLPRIRAATAQSTSAPSDPPPAEPDPLPPFVEQAIERDAEERPPPQ